ncbi:glycoside hydrolase superfamily [Dichotomocladium elegans]|nr:glycoside hydrolase superfamily [Dichotomocladium elegans]
MKVSSITSAILLVTSAALSARGAPSTSTSYHHGVLSWEEAYAKAHKLVSQMTLEQRVNVTTGTGNEQGPCEGNTAPTDLFPALCLNDGPMGLRHSYNVSQFVTGINAAATWDRVLMRERAVQIGREFREKGVNVILGPGMNMLRAPEAGRNWEFGGEDPYLVGELTYETVIGYQSSGVITTSKHIIGNEQDTNRYTSNTIMDDKTLHEVYLYPFERAVEAGTTGVMCSYNKVNGTYACENDYVLNTVLKGELSFKGFVVSDWWATHSTVTAVKNGLDMTMPGDANADSITGGGLWFGKNLTDAVERGDIEEARVTDMATRIVAAWYKVGQDKDYPSLRYNYFDYNIDSDVDVQGNSKDNIRKSGAASVVLLRNEDNILPIQPQKINKIAIIGDDAGPDPEGLNQCAENGCARGTLTAGWGSGTAYLPYLVTPLDGIKERAGNNFEIVSYLGEYDFEEASKVASDADIAFVFAKADSGEMYVHVEDVLNGDRNNLSLWHQGDDLIKAVADANKNTVVVIHSVGPILMPWHDHPNIKAIVWPGLPGQETGHSLADVLFGDVNPSGRLPYTIAKQASDYVAHIITEELDIPYTEGVYIGYRHFDKNNIDPLYEFGYGLSYTTFEYSHLKVVVLQNKKTVKASLTIANTGDVDGHEIVQAYISYPEGVDQPPKVLRGFEKVAVKKGKKSKVSFEFTDKDLRVWDTVSHQWVVPQGTYTVLIGHSSRDIRASDTFTI